MQPQPSAITGLSALIGERREEPQGTVLYYVDTVSMLEAATLSAERLAVDCGLRPVFIVIDSAKYAAALSEHYEVRDYAAIFQPPPPRARPRSGLRVWLHQAETAIRASLGLPPPKPLLERAPRKRLQLPTRTAIKMYLTHQVRLAAYRTRLLQAKLYRLSQRLGFGWLAPSALRVRFHHWSNLGVYRYRLAKLHLHNALSRSAFGRVLLTLNLGRVRVWLRHRANLAVYGYRLAKLHLHNALSKSAIGRVLLTLNLGRIRVWLRHRANLAVYGYRLTKLRLHNALSKSAFGRALLTVNLGRVRVWLRHRANLTIYCYRLAKLRTHQALMRSRVGRVVARELQLGVWKVRARHCLNLALLRVRELRSFVYVRLGVPGPRTLARFMHRFAVQRGAPDWVLVRTEKWSVGSRRALNFLALSPFLLVAWGAWSIHQRASALIPVVALPTQAKRAIEAFPKQVSRHLARAQGLILARITAAASAPARAMQAIENWEFPKLVRRRMARAKYLILVRNGLRAQLADINPKAIVVLEDNIQTVSRLLIEEGRRRGVPTVILPFTIPNPLEPANYYADDREYHADSLLERLFLSAYPHWGFTFEGKRMLRLPLTEAAAFQALGYATSAPWLLNAGDAAAIVLDSEAMRRHYLALGFPHHQLRVIGEPTGGIMSRARDQRGALKALLCQQYGWDFELPIVLCGFPPNQYENTTGSREFEYSTFEALIEGWMRAFTVLEGRANVLVRPHPRLPLSTLAAYERKHVRLSATPTAELIPIADVYTASISATIRWALASGVPTLNYDCYRFRYEDYAASKAVIRIETLAEFQKELERLIATPQALHALRAKAAADALQWGIIDDGFGERFASVIRSVTAAGTTHRDREPSISFGEIAPRVSAQAH